MVHNNRVHTVQYNSNNIPGTILVSREKVERIIISKRLGEIIGVKYKTSYINGHAGTPGKNKPNPL